MKAEELFEIIGETDPAMAAEALEYSPKRLKPALFCAIAACLCIIVIGLSANKTPPVADGGSGEPYAAGGLFPDGVDPVIYSISVYPAFEDVRNVDTAEILDLDREQAASEAGLGEHLPAYLPEGFSFRSAYLYKTVMKNGTVYRMLRVTYTNAPLPEAVTFTDENGEQAAYLPEGAVFPSQITVSLFDFTPDTDRIYSVDELDGDTVTSGYFTVLKDGIYMGIEPLDHDGDLSAEDIMKLIDSIR